MIKKYSFIVFCFISLLLVFTGCQTNDSNLEKSPAQKRSESENGVTIKTEKAEYPISVKTITVEIQNDSNEEYMTGAHVFLEKKVEGIWRTVPMKAESFTEQGIIHPPNKLSSLDLNVNDLKYKLTPGEYRATIGELAAPFKVVE
ncbi:immunoglobulin-like domain-containing protein [Pseudobacillus sp. 179-B 2D1 NHS]|uniref:immunoglobulin-like domain-containing protein n=1 Tax=Pseudobacillus sp. 179-B 2D1 NHS TaxID=3374292 RepID=UPI00387A8279